MGELAGGIEPMRGIICVSISGGCKTFTSALSSLLVAWGRW
jgi:hypothetical protein